jgi:hypothetical protein
MSDADPAGRPADEIESEEAVTLEVAGWPVDQPPGHPVTVAPPPKTRVWVREAQAWWPAIVHGQGRQNGPRLQVYVALDENTVFRNVRFRRVRLPAAEELGDTPPSTGDGPRWAWPEGRPEPC